MTYASLENTCVEPVELKAFQRVLEMAITCMDLASVLAST
jgi:hypothetical protein